MEHLVRAVARASGITRDVLDFAAPRPFAMQPVDVVAFTRELAPNFRQVLAPRVRLDLDLPDHAAYARLDRAQLERLLLNLLTNAREVTPEGGLVSVILRHDAGRVQWQVRDGGPGVPHALRDRIFEPFFTTKGTTGGTGLGLASAFAIARPHDGTLRVGDAPDGGAEFVLELSACAECTAPVGENGPELARRANGQPLQGVVVMLVEDDVALARLGTRLLQRAGAIVQRYDNGVDAVASLREARATQALPQLIITDLRLPRGSGAEVIEVARQVNAAVPVVAVSGFLEDPLVAELAARQELSFLAKPFSEQQLLDAIDMAQRFAAV